MYEKLTGEKEKEIHFRICIRRKTVEVRFIRDWISTPSTTSHFEFYSDGSVVSDTGYRSHFTMGRIDEKEDYKKIAQELAEEIDKKNFAHNENAVLTAWCGDDIIGVDVR